MDEKMLNELKNFEKVWQRVKNEKQGRQAAEKAGLKLRPGKQPKGGSRFAPFN